MGVESKTTPSISFFQGEEVQVELKLIERIYYIKVVKEQGRLAIGQFKSWKRKKSSKDERKNSKYFVR